MTMRTVGDTKTSDDRGCEDPMRNDIKTNKTKYNLRRSCRLRRLVSWDKCVRLLYPTFTWSFFVGVSAADALIPHRRMSFLSHPLPCCYYYCFVTHQSVSGIAFRAGFFLAPPRRYTTFFFQPFLAYPQFRYGVKQLQYHLKMTRYNHFRSRKGVTTTARFWTRSIYRVSAGTMGRLYYWERLSRTAPSLKTERFFCSLQCRRIITVITGDKINSSSSSYTVCGVFHMKTPETRRK